MPNIGIQNPQQFNQNLFPFPVEVEMNGQKFIRDPETGGAVPREQYDKDHPNWEEEMKQSGGTSILEKVFNWLNGGKGGGPGGVQFLDTLDPWQRKLFDKQGSAMEGGPFTVQQSPAYSSGMDYLQRVLSQDPEMMKAFEAPALRQFKEQILPDIRTQFSGQKGGSHFQLASANAATDLGERLAAQRANLGMSALPQALGYAQQPISNLQNFLNLQTKSAYDPNAAMGGGGFLKELFGKIGPIASNALISWITSGFNPAGAAAGAVKGAIK